MRSRHSRVRVVGGAADADEELGQRGDGEPRVALGLRPELAALLDGDEDARVDEVAAHRGIMSSVVRPVS